MRLCAGLPADGTIAAEVAFMFNEWFKPAAFLEYPRGGSQAIVNALVRCGARAIDPPASARPCERPLVPAILNCRCCRCWGGSAHARAPRGSAMRGRRGVKTAGGRMLLNAHAEEIELGLS